MTNKCLYIPKERIDETLAQSPQTGKRLLEPLKSFSAEHAAPFNILEDCQVSNDAEIHQHESDLWYCIEGEVRFVCGGQMVDPWFKQLPDGTEDRREIKAKTIEGGEEILLHAGDWLWIPAGEAHQHFCADTARLVIIKIPKV